LDTSGTDIQRTRLAFEKLGEHLRAMRSAPDEAFTSTVARAVAANAWFTEEQVGHAMDGIVAMLRPDVLDTWLEPYRADLYRDRPMHEVAVVMAGNIPLVGFHDLMCVLLAGHRAHIKPSSQDTVLMQAMRDMLTAIEPTLEARMEWHGHLLSGFTHVIATGSNNTSRYFESYFARFRHVIRRNRSSVAVLTGHETPDDLHALGRDIFRYFGLGCRNVSKVYVPSGYDLTTLMRGLEGWNDIILHHKYHNNYDYQKAILLVECLPHLDNGALLLREHDAVASAVSVLHYAQYGSMDGLTADLARHRDQIQCIVAGTSIPGNDTVPFGMAQCPAPWDYADGVDTMRFLLAD
jgi:hypothetical protein